MSALVTWRTQTRTGQRACLGRGALGRGMGRTLASYMSGPWKHSARSFAWYVNLDMLGGCTWSARAGYGGDAADDERGLGWLRERGIERRRVAGALGRVAARKRVASTQREATQEGSAPEITPARQHPPRKREGGKKQLPRLGFFHE